MGARTFVHASLRSRYRRIVIRASRIQDIIQVGAEKAHVLRGRHVRECDRAQPWDGTFELHALPVEAQFAPIYASLAGDFDGDGKIDLVTAGNFSGVTPLEGRYDASYGLLLHGDGRVDLPRWIWSTAAWRSMDKSATWLC